MSDSDHQWLREGEALGFEMDSQSMGRRFIAMHPQDRVNWLNQFSRFVAADESPLRKRAQLEKRLRDLKKLNFELKAMNR